MHLANLSFLFLRYVDKSDKMNCSRKDNTISCASLTFRRQDPRNGALIEVKTQKSSVNRFRQQDTQRALGMDTRSFSAPASVLRQRSAYIDRTDAPMPSRLPVASSFKRSSDAGSSDGVEL
jgi:hypothetical protein